MRDSDATRVERERTDEGHLESIGMLSETVSTRHSSCASTDDEHSFRGHLRS